MLQSQRSRFIERNFFIIATVALVVVAVVLLANLFLLNRETEEQLSDSRVVNVAGRQRMLSQQISKNVALFVAEDEPLLRAEYVTNIADETAIWQQSHQGLRFGSDELDLPGDNSDEVDTLFVALQPHYDTMLSNALCLVAVERNQPSAVGCNDDVQALGASILATEGRYLQTMNRIVFQYDAESKTRVEDLQANQQLVLLGLIGVVIGILLLIVVPVGFRVRSMSQQLSASTTEIQERTALLENLQVQAETRSRNLQAVIDLSARVSTILNINQLLRDVSDLTRERFGLYHAHIYYLDDDGQALRLVAGAGYIGEQMVAEERSIDLSDLSSIVARAGRSIGSVVVNDVRREPDFSPHALLPRTASEMAIALQSRGQLLGVLDLQSDETGFFDNEQQIVMEAVASQVAVAISNATLFQSLQTITSHERALGEISRTIEDATSVDEILQTTVRELGKALRIPYTAIELQLQDKLPSADGERAGQPS